MNKGKELAQRRMKLNLSQYQVAEKLGVNQSTVCRIEQGLNDKLSLHIAYNGLLSELEQGFIDTVELANDLGIPVPEEDYILYSELTGKGVEDGKKES